MAEKTVPISNYFSILLHFFILVVQVLLTPTHLAIVMEYAAGGELFERICNAGRFSEDEVTFCKHFSDLNSMLCTVYF